MADETIRRLTSILQVSFELLAATGLRIGAASESIAIGGSDNPVVRDPLTGQPYIPGSSLKGKMRSLLERVYGLDQNWAIQRPRVFIHACADEQSYASCTHCQLFGVPAPERERWFCQTRLRVADLFLSHASEEHLRAASTDLPYTELKSEAAIDRITSAAVPRTMERVPAGARFGPSQFGLFLYERDEPRQLLDHVVQGFELLEADFLGGAGARGSGRVRVQGIRVSEVAFPEDTSMGQRRSFDGVFETVRNLREGLNRVSEWLAVRS